MDTSARNPIARLAVHEFRRTFGVRLSDMYMPWTSSRLDRILSVSGVAMGVMYVWGMAGFTRGWMVDWHGVSGSGVLSWLLWGLGGLIPVVLAVRAGWIGSEQMLAASLQRITKPVTHLLPLSATQALAAIIMGRAWAVVVALGVGMVILALARYLMVAQQLVNSLPSLIDPWLCAAPLLFYGFLVVTTRNAAESRRWDTGVAGLRSLWITLGAVAGLGACYAAKLNFSVHWQLTAYVAFAAAGVTAVVACQVLSNAMGRARLPADRPLASGQDPYDALLRPTLLARWTKAAAGAQGFGLGEAGRSVLTRRWLKRSAAFATVLAVLLTLSSALWQLGAVVVCGPSSSSCEAAIEFGVGGVVALFGFAILIMAVALWQEIIVVDSRTARYMGQVADPFGRKHVGLLLPVPIRRLWAQRLLGLLMMCALLVVAGAASHGVSWRLGQLLAGSDLASVGPVLYWIFPAALVLALVAFALVPLLGRAARTVEISGCLLWGLCYCSAFGAAAIFVALRLDRVSGPAFTYYTLLVAIAWWALVLVFSWLGCEPSAWRLTDTGAPSFAGKLQALFVHLALILTCGCVGCLFIILL